VGFFAGVANRVRAIWSKDKDQLPIQFAKGNTTSSTPMTGYDVLQSYGNDVVADYLRLEADLMHRYVDYEEMGEYPTISGALDIYADDATQLDNHHHKKVWVTSPDKEIEDNLNYMLHKRVRIDEEIWSMTRTLCQYGSSYEEMLVTEEGVGGLLHLSPPTVRRIEGPRGELFGFIQDPRGKFSYSISEFQQMLASKNSSAGRANLDPSHNSQDRVTAFEDWEVIHFRLQSRRRRSVYGSSMLDSVRWIWKRLVMLEDSAMIYRLQRAPERYAFYVDVGDLPPQESLAWLNKVRQQFRKKKFVDPTTGKLNLKFEQLSPDDDFYVPVRKGTDGTRIEVLGAPAWQSVDDLLYFENKMFAGLKIPRSYLAQDDSAARNSLSSQDARFARTEQRIQGAVKDGVSKICRVHLMALGIDPHDVEYTVHMALPSPILEMGQLEAMNARADLASRMGDFVDPEWILANIFRLNEDEISIIMQRREEAKIRDFVSEARAQAAATAEFPNYQPGAPAGAFAPQPGFGGDAGAPPGQQPPDGGDGSQGGDQPAQPSGASFPDQGGDGGESSPKPGNIFSANRERLRAKNNRALHERSKAASLVEKQLFEKLDKLRSRDEMLDARLKQMSVLLRDLSSRPVSRDTRSGS
jgi:hypothetical protein